MAASLPEKSQTASDWIATLQLRWLALIGERFSPLPNKREFAKALAGAHTPVRSEVPGTAAARSSYRPAAKAPRRTAELLPLQSRAVRGAVDGSLPPARILRKTMSSTAGNETAKDSMDEIKADPEQRSQGTSPPSLLGSYFEAGDEDQGEGLGTTHGDHGGSTSSSSDSTKKPIQEADPVAACGFSGAHQPGSTSGSTR